MQQHNARSSVKSDVYPESGRDRCMGVAETSVCVCVYDSCVCYINVTGRESTGEHPDPVEPMSFT